MTLADRRQSIASSHQKACSKPSTLSPASAQHQKAMKICFADIRLQSVLAVLRWSFTEFGHCSQVALESHS